MSKRTEIVCVGNELLIGKTLNTNANWLARRATSLGIAVKRITVVSDDVEEIAMVIREVLQRKPHFAITTGGLGPTFDDKTLEGLSKALNLELEVNEKALDMIKQRYETYRKEGRIEKAELTPPRVKMATLPQGAQPLHNAVGTAPGVMLKVGKTLLLALPGVPPEMEAIFEESVAPLLKKAAGKITFFETSLYADNVVESALAPLIDRAMHDNPYVYVKSHVYAKNPPESMEKKRPHIELHLSTTSKDSKTAHKLLERTVAELSELIEKNGGTVKLPRKNQ
jgi:nicotinamide-nucleotide amidase